MSKRPPTWDESVIKDTVGHVPLGILFHSIIGIWMCGNQEVFPSDTVIDIREMTNTDEDDYPIGGFAHEFFVR